jgi:type II secretory pathway pseudopilin PulG
MQRQQLFIVSFGVIAVLAIVAVVLVGGTPSEVRQQKLDEQRVSDLRQIENGITDYARTQVRLNQLNGVDAPTRPYLPDDIAVFDVSSVGGYYIYDPLTKEKYGYNIIGSTNYELCATFAVANNQTTTQLSSVDRLWLHPAGLHCFNLTIDLDRLKTELKPSYALPVVPLKD